MSGSPKPLSVGLQIKFIRQVWDYQQSAGWVYTPWKPDGALPWKVKYWRYPAVTNEELGEWLKNRQGDDVYFSPTIYSDPEGKRESALPSRVLYADFDQVDPRYLGQGKPTAIWETSPGSWQGLYFLSTPLEPTEWAQWNKKVTYWFGADKGCWQINRVLRIPGRRNHKEAYRERWSEGAPGLWHEWSPSRIIDLGDDFWSAMPEVKSGSLELVLGSMDDIDREAVIKRLPGRVKAMLANEEWPDRSKGVHILAKELFQAMLTGPEVGSVLLGTEIFQEKYGGRQNVNVELEREVSKARQALGGMDGEDDDGLQDIETLQAKQEIWDMRPELAYIRAFARWRQIAPWALLGSVLVRIATVIPPGVGLPPLIGGRASLNLFVGLVDPSGGGKGAAMAAGLECMDLRFPELNLGSGEGILHQYVGTRKSKVKGKEGQVEQYRKESAILFTAAEIDILTAMQARSASTVGALLRQAWSGEALGFAYADSSKSLYLPRHDYRLTLMCGIQPRRAKSLIDGQDGGLPQRFLFFSSIDESAEIGEEPEEYEWKFPEFNVGASIVMSEDDGFKSEFDLELSDRIKADISEERIKRLRGMEIEPLDAHRNLSKLKVAGILAYMNGRFEVTDDDWDIAGLVMAESIRVRDEILAELRVMKREESRARGKDKATERHAEIMASDSYTTTELWVMDALTKAGGKQTMGKLKSRCPTKKREYLTESLERLENAGVIKRKEGQRIDSVIWTMVASDK